ncbi:o-succinylbenzoate synthase [Vagococcus luciliae]|uniref:o-succinylbenzoate synthase n=1 Tax=Vagococcus luciliae TaxID=2920380 RepID=A0ABY5NWX0_9ENTE|nr:o-succinylbenzoate synthase [Vagococcus luciliae]UUV98149.1 o-succinylbenzoate synthase [Vagococcus luciliae]
MNITKIESYRIKLPLLSPFKTSYGYLTHKAMDILVVTDEFGNQGFGELVAFEQPDYTEETLETARLVLKHHLLPLVINKNIHHPNDVFSLLSVVRGNWMAKSAIETAIWDMYAKRQQMSLAKLCHSQSSNIEVGVSIGIQKSISDLLAVVSEYVDEGYRRIKLKIAPNQDISFVKAVREAFPNILLMVDANSAYTLKDVSIFKELDCYELSMIEQPFGYSDFLEHATLQKQIKTPICLDENIRSVEDVTLAHHLGSLGAVNLKISRVGGIFQAQKIVDYCKEQGLMLWCGGMFESGVGRALNIAFASQQGFNFPGDISASNRYFEEDIINEVFVLEDGRISVPNKEGIGVSLNEEMLSKYGTHQFIYEK